MRPLHAAFLNRGCTPGRGKNNLSLVFGVPRCQMKKFHEVYLNRSQSKLFKFKIKMGFKDSLSGKMPHSCSKARGRVFDSPDKNIFKFCEFSSDLSCPTPRDYFYDPHNF